MAFLFEVNGATPMRLVMIDNYDSFTYNLVQLFYEFDLGVMVFRHDEITLSGIKRLKPDWICISPGPKDPAYAGISNDVVRLFGEHIPILGVCLGMQVINEVFSGRTLSAPLPMHGKRSQVFHSGKGIFANIPSPFWAARYHSLCTELKSGEDPICFHGDVDHGGELISVGYASDGVIMAVQHRSLPVWGVQFHPESFMTEFGLELVSNFLELNKRFKSYNCSAITSEDRFPRNGWSGIQSTFAEEAFPGRAL
jgi:anthranilate synthase component II